MGTCFRLLDISWVASKSIRYHLLAWEASSEGNWRRRGRSWFDLMRFFGVFGERQQRVFDGVETPLDRFKINFIKTPFFGVTTISDLMWLAVWIVCILVVCSLLQDASCASSHLLAIY